MPVTADLLLTNANVLTMDPARPRARWVAIASGRILAVGDDPDGPAGVQAREVADLRGATLLPGFHDAHNHMAWYGHVVVRGRSAAGGDADARRAVPGRGGAGRRDRTG
jgi:predicted amidohydrolase YtcJ